LFVNVYLLIAPGEGVDGKKFHLARFAVIFCPFYALSLDFPNESPELLSHLTMIVLLIDLRSGIASYSATSNPSLGATGI